MFKVYPLTRTDDVHVWYRQRIADDDWDAEMADTTVVNMDDELLILGTIYDYLSDDASNPDAVTKYENQYNLRYQQLVNLGFQHGIAKSSQSNGVPADWAING
jgi:hypothetical protein